DSDEAEGRFKEALDKQGEVVKNFQTDAVVYQKSSDSIPGEEPELEKVTEGAASMNQPLKFGSYSLYQSGYQQNEFTSISFNIEKMAEFKDLTFKVSTQDNDKEKDLGSFTVNLDDQQDEYKLEDGYRVQVGQYYPDFYIDDGEPKSNDDQPRNPGFVFFVYPPDGGDPQTSFVGIDGNIAATGDDVEIETDDYTLRKDDAEEDSLGEFKIDLNSPESEYKLDNGTR